MVLYNITIILDDSINTEWLGWVNNGFIDPVMKTALFTSNRLLKVVDSPNEGVTYCVQFVADNPGSYQQFKQDHEAAVMGSLNERFGNRLVSFSTLMEFIG